MKPLKLRRRCRLHRIAWPSRCRLTSSGPGGVNIRNLGFQPLEEEARLFDYKLPLVHAYARANHLDGHSFGAERPRLGIVTAGKAYLDVLQALTTLGIDEQRAAVLGDRRLQSRFDLAAGARGAHYLCARHRRAVVRRRESLVHGSSGGGQPL